jgi:hypothetical protein
MTPAEQIEYFETAAKRNRAIGHVPDAPDNKRFFRMDIAELESDLRSRVKGLSLVIEHSIDAEEDGLSDNPYINQSSAFWIIHPITRPDDYDANNELRDLCYRVTWQLYTKLRNDKRKGIFRGFEPNTFTVEAFTNLDNTIVGYRAAFKQKEPAPRELNPDEWTDETPAE